MLIKGRNPNSVLLTDLEHHAIALFLPDQRTAYLAEGDEGRKEGAKIEIHTSPFSSKTHVILRS